MFSAKEWLRVFVAGSLIKRCPPTELRLTLLSPVIELKRYAVYPLSWLEESPLVALLPEASASASFLPTWTVPALMEREARASFIFLFLLSSFESNPPEHAGVYVPFSGVSCLPAVLVFYTVSTIFSDVCLPAGRHWRMCGVSAVARLLFTLAAFYSSFSKAACMCFSIEYS